MSTRKRASSKCAAACVVALVTLGVSFAAQAQPRHTFVVRRPPRPIVQVVTPRPTPVSVWVDGYWAWNGADYHWVVGRWVAAPRPGVVWRPGRWEPVRGGHRFVAGGWIRHSPRAHLRYGRPVYHAPPQRFLVHRRHHRHHRRHHHRHD